MKNRPISRFFRPSFHQVNTAIPLRIAVQTTFADGTNSVHLQRANEINKEIIRLLKESDSDKLNFFHVDHFEAAPTIDYDYLLSINGSCPLHETKRNKALLLIGWPATLSVIAAPLGAAVLSIPGIVKETTTFNWEISISPKFNKGMKLKSVKVPAQEAIVSATAWGVSKEKLKESYQYADSYVKNATVEFVNDLDWTALIKKASAYAAAQPRPVYNEIRIETGSMTTQINTRISNDQRFAVVIGISKYLYSHKNGITDLKYADDDALDIYNVLKNSGWKENQIKLLINRNASKREISIAIESWLTKADDNDLILLFWAGHAFPDPGDPEKVYFACYDTDITIPATGLRMDRVRDFLEERNAKNTIVIADTCHAGKLITRGTRGVTVQPYLEKIKKTSDIPKGWVFIVGAESDRQAIEDASWKNGAFTHCLLSALKGKADGYESAGPRDNQITLGEIKAYMNSAMPEETLRVLGIAKHPIINTSSGDPTIWKLPLVFPKQ